MTGKSKDTHLLASIKAFLRRNIPSIYLPIAIWWNKILKRERLKSKLLQKYTTLNGWEVRHGPFTGMLLTEYSRERLPILIGSYEDEIQAWVREIIKTKYDHIVNIGSGTGYYAIGLALQMPWVSITAFEADISVQEIFRRNVE